MDIIFKKKSLIFFLLAPVGILYLVYIIVPLAMGSFYSFTNFSGVGAYKMVGLANYEYIFTSKTIYIAMKNTGIIFVGMLLNIPIGFLVATLVSHRFAVARNFFKVVFYLPGIVAPILSAIVFIYIFDPQIGFLNNLLRSAGIGKFAVMWIGGPSFTPITVFIIQNWMGLGSIMLLLLSGMSAIQSEIYEAADIDGANGLQKMFKITLPLLSGSLKSIVVLQMAAALKTFEVVKVLTDGGPNRLSETLMSMITYEIRTSNLFNSMVIMVILFVLIMSVSIAFMVITQKSEDYS